MRMELIAVIIWITVTMFAISTISSTQTGLGGVNGFPITLPLQRAFPMDKRVVLSQLIDRDRTRHDQLAQKDVVEFPLYSTADIDGLYYTNVRLGTPAQEFSVFIDTGNDDLWVRCANCSNCPMSSKININHNAFNTSSSSTASTISCSDKKCKRRESECNRLNNHCSYNIQYEDGSGTSGYYVNDVLHLDYRNGSSDNTSTAAKIVFGCSTSLMRSFTGKHIQVDGIFGLGRTSSIISQIYPQVFSHCLRGDLKGGGVLVLGEIMDPNMVYTPLVPHMPHYNVYMESISVGNQTLVIDSSSNEKSNLGGTLIDTGTTLSYLAESVYDIFIDAITKAVYKTTSAFSTMEGLQCYEIQSSVGYVFPKVRLNFKGGAYMVIDPEDYLFLKYYVDDINKIWCIRIQRTKGRAVNILGDIVLKNKVVVYDMAHQRIGWANYNCSEALNVTTHSSLISIGQRSTFSIRVQILIFILITTLFLHS